MLSLGIDVGTSSVKVSLFDQQTGRSVASAFYPEQEMKIIADRQGWAEQHPDWWWDAFKTAFSLAVQRSGVIPSDIDCIGISYQMHGLVCLDRDGNPLRPSIIWCDSRAVDFGNRALDELGEDYSFNHLLNSPGNFTASKLKWVKENEPDLYERIHKICLPGDYIAYKLTGELFTSISGLTEGVFYDFQTKSLSSELLDHYGLSEKLLPEAIPSFSQQGSVTAQIADELGLSETVSVTYRAGDQPNNAFSLQVLNPGETAATAGTSGVIYSVSDELFIDYSQMANSFAHVNYSAEDPRIGILLCINGVGSSMAWVNRIARNPGYEKMNDLAGGVGIGSDGLKFLPFGNGAERMLQNRNVGSHFMDLDFNRHSSGHLYRSVQEGVAFAFYYGLSGISNSGKMPDVIKAGQSNMFLSPVFCRIMADLIGVPIELYNTDGSEGAARGALVGAEILPVDKAFAGLVMKKRIEPKNQRSGSYREVYESWKQKLNQILKQVN